MGVQNVEEGNISKYGGTHCSLVKQTIQQNMLREIFSFFSFANRNHQGNRHVGNEVKHFVSRCLIGCSCLSLFSLYLICVSQCVKIKERMYVSSFFSSLSLWTCLNDNVRHHVCRTHCSFTFYIDKRSVFVFALLVVGQYCQDLINLSLSML